MTERRYGQLLSSVFTFLPRSVSINNGDNSQDTRKKHKAPLLDGTRSQVRVSAARRCEGGWRDGTRQSWRKVAGEVTKISINIFLVLVWWLPPLTCSPRRPNVSLQPPPLRLSSSHLLTFKVKQNVEKLESSHLLSLTLRQSNKDQDDMRG